MQIRSALTWVFFSALLALFLAAVSVVFGGGKGEQTVLIPRGAALPSVTQQLTREGVLTNPLMFKAFVRATGGSRRIRAGEYAFARDMGFINAALVLYFSPPVVHAVTVPEGWNVRQIAQILAAKALVEPNAFIALALSPSGPKKYKLNSPNLEGFLFPDTYTFSRIDGEQRILDRMVQRFFEKVDSALIAKARAMGLSLEEMVTLASIIEKETGAAPERELISSVFHNRLKKRMRLQSDPTTIYGIPNFDGNLTKKHLRTPTPYNTYTIPALPPGAIASPGLAALKATVAPANSEYLYFVANNQGSHLFSKTYKQHAEYVNEYQKRRNSRKASSQAGAISVGKQ